MSQIAFGLILTLHAHQPRALAMVIAYLLMTTVEPTKEGYFVAIDGRTCLRVAHPSAEQDIDQPVVNTPPVTIMIGGGLQLKHLLAVKDIVPTEDDKSIRFRVEAGKAVVDFIALKSHSVV